MIELSCKRCGYTTSERSNLVKHLKRVKECPAVLSGEDRSVILAETYLRNYEASDSTCKFCAKQFKSAASLCRHKKLCKKNINNSTNILNNLQNEVKHLKEYISSKLKNDRNQIEIQSLKDEIILSKYSV
jgi:hypothetical protein